MVKSSDNLSSVESDTEQVSSTEKRKRKLDDLNAMVGRPEEGEKSTLELDSNDLRNAESNKMKMILKDREMDPALDRDMNP